MSEPKALTELIGDWRDDGGSVRGYCADQLENALREWMEAYKAGGGDRNLQCWYMEKMLGMAERQQASSEKEKE